MRYALLVIGLLSSCSPQLWPVTVSGKSFGRVQECQEMLPTGYGPRTQVVTTRYRLVIDAAVECRVGVEVHEGTLGDTPYVCVSDTHRCYRRSQ